MQTLLHFLFINKKASKLNKSLSTCSKYVTCYEYISRVMFLYMNSKRVEPSENPHENVNDMKGLALKNHRILFHFSPLWQHVLITANVTMHSDKNNFLAFKNITFLKKNYIQSPFKTI